ncbi:hypothetical protein CR513_13355, partial [Mucuna pruriens]
MKTEVQDHYNLESNYPQSISRTTIVMQLFKTPPSTALQFQCLLLLSLIIYNKFSPFHKAFLSAITSHDEPKTFSQVVKHSKWCEAMIQEIKALKENNISTLELLLEGKKLVYKIKYKANGEINKYKAQLVAKEVETSPNGVSNAFLHGDLNEEVNMIVPLGYVVTNLKHICCLRKSFYGLKQTSRNFAYHNLFTYSMGHIFLAILVYVDDLVKVGNDTSTCNGFKDYISKCFHMKDLGKLKYFLGLDLSHGNTCLFFANTSTQ